MAITTVYIFVCDECGTVVTKKKEIELYRTDMPASVLPKWEYKWKFGTINKLLCPKCVKKFHKSQKFKDYLAIKEKIYKELTGVDKAKDKIFDTFTDESPEEISEIENVANKKIKKHMKNVKQLENKITVLSKRKVG